MPKKTTSPKDEPGLPEGLHLPEGDLEGIVITEEVVEVEVVVPEDLEDDEEFDSIFSGVKKKKITLEEEEDIEDFNSYFFEE
ncbi:MAG: hypothetical protein RJB39_477 [Candidatus Parcubacteria bacterium]|jgi:hypothetical protein